MWWFLIGLALGQQSSTKSEMTEEESKQLVSGCLIICAALGVSFLILQIMAALAPHLGYSEGFTGEVEMIRDTMQWLPGALLVGLVTAPLFILIISRLKK